MYWDCNVLTGLLGGEWISLSTSSHHYYVATVLVLSTFKFLKVTVRINLIN